jgi:undecaprenyl-diphosphatase
MARFWIRALLYTAGAVFAAKLLLPQMGGLHQTWYVLRGVRWGWLVTGLLVVPLVYLAAAMALAGSVNHPLGIRRTALVQLAGSFVNKLTPRGLGGMGVNERYLVRSGVERPVALAGIALNMAAGFVVHAISLMAVSLLLGWRGAQGYSLPSNWPVFLTLGTVFVTLAAVTLALWTEARRKISAPILASLRGFLDVLRSPTRAAVLFAGVAGVTAANVVMLTISLHAFGVHPSLLKIGAVYLGGSAVASASPTPGNLGAIEAVLVANLTTVGVQMSPAIAAVLVYRLLAFWLPIIPGLLAFQHLRRQQIL